MNHESYGWETVASDQESAPGDEDSADFEFEQGPDSGAGRPGRVRRFFWRTLPVVVLTGLLVVVAEYPDLLRVLHRPPPDAPVQITVVCDVPWAIIRVDGHGVGTSCAQDTAGALPMARVSVSVGQHTLVATAEGFVPYPIYIVAHPNTSGLYLTQFALTPRGATQALDAVNDYFATAYSQDVVFPASLWQALGLHEAPSGPVLVVRERFEATSLDSYEPVYTETTYQRPIAPQQGSLGIAAVVVEHVTVYDGCSVTPLLERRMPLLYETRASVILSARPGSQNWTATNPYALNPAADIYTAPNIAATPTTPAGLLILAARTALAENLGSMSMLASAITVLPLVNSTHWAAGAVLTLRSGARQEAIWLYAGGQLVALTDAAHALSPSVAFGAPLVTLDSLRARLANWASRICGGH
jgi:hypothetical protein